MTTITTTGQIGSLLSTQESTFSGTIENIENKSYTTLADVYYDVSYGNFSIYTLTSSRVDGYLYGAAGDFSLLGSGFNTSKPKISEIDFYGNDGFNFGIKGSFTSSSIKLTEVSASWNGDSIYFRGSLDESGFGRISTIGVSADGLSMAMDGSLSFSSSGISGNFKSVLLGDGTGDSISINGNISYDTWGGSALTIDDLLNSQAIFSGNDTFNVPDAAREWHGYGGNDKLYGGAQDDVLYGDDGNDKLYGYDGDDILVGGSGNDQITGGNGDDYIEGGDGNDKITDTAGNNVVIDVSGNANISVGDGSDTIVTGSGNDKIVAGDGNNEISAGDGNNKVTSLNGNDTITTGSGNDNINVGGGNNDVSAGAGNDKVVTGSGNDTINGGDGKDNLSGGAGADKFVFDNIAQGGFDTIGDFLTTSDVLVFDDTVFTSLSGGISDANLLVGSKATAQDADDYLILDTSGGKLYYDVDGNGAGAAIQIAALKGVTTLDISNLLVE